MADRRDESSTRGAVDAPGGNRGGGAVAGPRASAGRGRGRVGPPSRRALLIAGGAVAAAAGGGIALGLTTATHDQPDPVDSRAAGVTGTPTPLTAQTPAVLAAAIDAERDLVDGATAALRGATGTRRALLRTVRADHVAHLQALTAAAAQVTGSSSASGRRRRDRSVRHVDSRSEARASRAAARRALRTDGTASVLLASIAASEATHAELLA